MNADQKEHPTASNPDDMRAAEQQFKRDVRQAGGTPSRAIDFNTFLISLGSSALFHLGVGTPPHGEKVEINYEVAHQTIDILAMLEQKTRGNLSDEESQLLSTLLYDLRLRFVESLKKAGQE